MWYNQSIRKSGIRITKSESSNFIFQNSVFSLVFELNEKRPNESIIEVSKYKTQILNTFEFSNFGKSGFFLPLISLWNTGYYDSLSYTCNNDGYMDKKKTNTK